MTTRPNAWQTTPRKSMVIFLLAVFFTFASIGFTSDVINLGLQPLLRFGLVVFLIGLFAVCYSLSGIILRGRFWKVAVPIFIVQFVGLGLLGKFMPDGAQPMQLGIEALAQLQKRMAFDGMAIILTVSLGYTGLVYVSISEGRRHGRMQMEKAMLESEMAAAREVQRVVVPEDLPQIEGYAIESAYRPAAEVGGDFFQVIPLASGRALVAIGDVSGKGLRAAMIVSMIVGVLRTVSRYTEEPAEILSELNRQLCGHMQEGFATCAVVRLEDGGVFTLANAGHLPPYLHGRQMQVEGSLPLGLSEYADYAQIMGRIAAGDRLVLLTDGVAEARNEQQELLGFDAEESMLRAGATVQHVVDAAQKHGQSDDITAIQVARMV